MTGPDDSPTKPAHSAEVEIPASPEEIWQAIATGHGMAAWIFPAEVGARQGGDMIIHREPFGADARATVTAWEPPRRFAFTEPVPGTGDQAPASLATEFLVETRRGGSCVVRVVSSLLRDGEGWDDMVGGANEGWRMALTILRAYLTHFAGQPVSTLQATADTGQPVRRREALATHLMTLLGVSTTGAPFRTSPPAPPLAGTVEHLQTGYVLLRSSEPYPALLAISAFPMNAATVSVNVLGRLYGSGDPALARREQQRWNAWLTRALPALAPHDTHPDTH